MPEPDDMIVPMLRELRKDFQGNFDQVNKHLDKIEGRLGKIETAQTSFRHALTADTMMSRLVTGDFEERIQALEKQVAMLLERH